MAPLWGESESRALIWTLLTHITGLSKASILVSQTPLDTTQMHFLEEAVLKLEHQEPIQYILGKAPFLDFEVFVDSNVLIPRPETEELVDWIIQSKKEKGGRFLDLCTGSGCIAIGLMRSGKWEAGDGLDVSIEALKLAEKSAVALGVNLDWMESDLLDSTFKLAPDSWDVIVSNPPYILPSEKSAMSGHVLDFEPEIALFVPENDPIIFYKIIADLASKGLKKGGHLYFELNPETADQVATYLESAGFAEVKIRLDMQGKKRMMRGLKN